ncbi:methyl-accepting chemotaxis protein [Salmonella enterica subsp. enterica]|nr:methyl-accepting chemotaxis protein [Salmonella enterica subsp. enterica]
MNPDISREVLSNWQALLEKGVVPQMQLAQQGSLTRLERTCQYGHARTQSRVRRQRGTV